MTLNWKDRGDGRYDALASCEVGGKYFIQWEKGYFSEQTNGYVETRCFRVDYQMKGGGSYGNVSQTHIHTLDKAKQLAELHHQKHKELLSAHGDYRKVPYEAWSRISCELLEWQERAP
jgi:hypothetical protein